MVFADVIMVHLYTIDEFGVKKFLGRWIFRFLFFFLFAITSFHIISFILLFQTLLFFIQQPLLPMNVFENGLGFRQYSYVVWINFACIRGIIVVEPGEPNFLLIKRIRSLQEFVDIIHDQEVLEYRYHVSGFIIN